MDFIEQPPPYFNAFSEVSFYSDVVGFNFFFCVSQDAHSLFIDRRIAEYRVYFISLC